MAKRNDDDFTFEIKEHYGVLSTSNSGWTKEFNLVSWNGKDAKYDIRDWHPEHNQMSKGVTLTEAEALELTELMYLKFGDSPAAELPA